VAGAAPETALEWLLATDFNERDPELSPDGRFLAYTSNESGRDEVYVVPYPGPGGKTQVSVAGGRLPRWNPNGRELFYVSGADFMAVAVETGTGFRRLTPEVLFSSSQLVVNGGLEAYAVAGPDGERLLMAIPGTPGAQPVEIRVVVNWFEELRALAPRTR
jgi:Tol biopolymer transport system component